jgi:hypothetical protein
MKIGSLHPHRIGPDLAKKRKRNLCDKCGSKTKTTGYRCQEGCDWDVCLTCMSSAEVQDGMSKVSLDVETGMEMQQEAEEEEV